VNRKISTKGAARNVLIGVSLEDEEEDFDI